jgi:serine protease Do
MRQMNKYAVSFLVIGFLLFSGQCFAENEPVRMIPQSFASIARQARSGVVNIQTVKTIKSDNQMYEHFFGLPFGNNRDQFEEFFAPFFHQQPRDRKEESLGSGFVISKDGYIVTNYHVIKGADQIKVILHDKTEFDGAVVGTDPMTDLALIKIKAGNLVPLAFGSSDNTPVGSWVVAIGSPFGLEQTVTAGIISAKGRIIGSGPFDDFIQTDASINPGNSGGPLLNLAGEVIGINTAITRTGQGIGFAIPSDLATGIIDQLTRNKSVSRGWLGVSIMDFKDQGDTGDKPVQGVYVEDVFKDEPAQKAGIKPGDIIYQIGDKKIETSRDLKIIIAGSAVGEKVDVHVLRDGKEKNIKVKLGELNKKTSQRISQTNEFDEFGLKLRILTPETARKYGYAENVKGLVVLDVEPGSGMSKTIIRHGDVLVKIGHRQITDLNSYQSAVDNIKKGEVVSLWFQRGNRHVFRINIRKG